MNKLTLTIAEGTFISESRRRSKSPEAAARSTMLKAVMPKLSGDRGKELASAFENADADKVRSVMTDIANELADALANKAE
jgi:hypothetical protein